MAPVYDLAHSKYAPTAIAGCFAAALVVLAVMVASTSAGIGGQLRPAATPAESRTVVDGPRGPALPVLREAAIPGLPATADQGGVTFRGADAPTEEAGPRGANPGPTDSNPTEPTNVVEVPPTPVDDTIEDTVDDVKELVTELTSILEALPAGSLLR